MQAISRAKAERLLASDPAFEINRKLPGGRWLITYTSRSKKGVWVYYGVMHIDPDGEIATRWLTKVSPLKKCIEDVLDALDGEAKRITKFRSVMEKNLHR